MKEKTVERFNADQARAMSVAGDAASTKKLLDEFYEEVAKEASLGHYDVVWEPSDELPDSVLNKAIDAIRKDGYVVLDSNGVLRVTWEPGDADPNVEHPIRFSESDEFVRG
jgi:hypothetical protein